jgi:MFS family permease
VIAPKRKIRAVLAFALAIVVAAQIVTFFVSWQLFKVNLGPALNEKAATVGFSLATKFELALSAGIPFEQLVDVEAFFDQIHTANADLAFLALGTPSGIVVHVVGATAEKIQPLLPDLLGVSPASTSLLTQRKGGSDFAISSVPILQNDRMVGAVHIGVSETFIARQINDVMLDIVIILICSLMIAVELITFIIAATLIAPLRLIEDQLKRTSKGDLRHLIDINAGELKIVGDALNALVTSALDLRARANRSIAQIGDHFKFPDGIPAIRKARRVLEVRLVTFGFMFAEQISRPFLPIYSRNLIDDTLTDRPELVTLPITAFLIVVAGTMPLATGWSDRIGSRTPFLTGAVLTTTGLLGAGFAFGLWDLVLWRVVTGLGYALMYCACQAFVLENTDDSDRARGIAMFVGAIMASEICAPGIGGILADNFGFGGAFVLSGGLMAATAFLGNSVLRTEIVRTPRVGSLFTPMIFKNKRFLLLLATSAFPAKLLLTALMYYLAPVALTSLGATPSEVGRIAMLYGVPSLLLSSLLAGYADKTGRYVSVIGLGGVLAPAGMAAVFLWPGKEAVIIAIIAFGIGQAMTIAPQFAMVTRLCKQEIERFGQGAVVGPYRLVERIGGAAGPIIAGSLASLVGPMAAISLMGLCTILLSLCFIIGFSISRIELSGRNSTAGEKA